jgi:hypothetical protein
VLRLGEQIDTQTVNSGPTGQLTQEHAARYIAKYATKSAEDFGLGDRRISPGKLPLLNVTDHVDRLVRAAWQLGEHPTYDELRRWVHMIGFRGPLAAIGRLGRPGVDCWWGWDPVRGGASPRSGGVFMVGPVRLTLVMIYFAKVNS